MLLFVLIPAGLVIRDVSRLAFLVWRGIRWVVGHGEFEAMQRVPRRWRQIIFEPLLTVIREVCERDVATSEAPRPCKTQVQVGAGHRTPFLLVGGETSKKIVPFYPRRDEVLQHCCAQCVADLVSRKSRIKSFL